MTAFKKWHVLVTGGGGYVGSVLIPELLAAGHRVTVLDLYLYGQDLFSGYKDNPNLREVKGDLRDIDVVENALQACDAVIHLACISNDPSYDLDPDLGKSINFDAFRPLVKAAKRQGVKRFIYASSSSVYGIKEEPEVTEDLSLEPLTDYSKFKALCEEVLEDEREPGFITCTVRPSTICGYAPRQRLDVIVNILTNHAVNNGRIKIFGGEQKRPNLHIKDMVALYLLLLQVDDAKINGKKFNAGYENYKVKDIAKMVHQTVAEVTGQNIDIVTEPTNDNRSYHVSSEKIRRELGFEAVHSVEEAIRDLVDAFEDGRLPNSIDDPQYYNIKQMQNIKLS